MVNLLFKKKNMKPAPLKKNKQSQPELLKQCRFLVEKFVKTDRMNEPNFWPREIKLASFLIKEHGFQVFVGLELKFKLNCLAYLKSAEGISYIIEAKNRAEKQKILNAIDFEDKKDDIEIGPDKLGDDIVLGKKKNSVFDFLN